MKVTYVVRECERKNINATGELLELCRALVDQEMMMDVAAAIMATQPGIEAMPTKPAGRPAALSLHWTVRELDKKRAT